MANLRVLAGDFLQGDGEYLGSTLTLETPLYPWPGIKIPANAIRTLELSGAGPALHADHAAIPGTISAALSSQTNLLTGGMAVSHRVEMTFWVTLKDGRKFLAAVDEKAYQRLALQIAKPDFFTTHK